MALLNDRKRIKWTFFKSVHFRVFIACTLILTMFCGVYIAILRNNWEQYWERQRQTETARYCNLIASEISFNDGMQEAYGSFLRSELHNMNSYLRVMVLDEKGRVLEDTSQSQTGAYIINDETLKAMAGTTATGSGELIYRVAVPVRDEQTNDVIGVVYGFADMSSLRESMAQTKSSMNAIAFALGLVAAGMFFLVIRRSMIPIRRILNWLQHFMSKERESTRPRFKVYDEYAQLVEAVDVATRDLITVDRSRQEFVSNVSHELKTPLSSIKVLTESLLLQKELPEEIYREFLTDINSEIDRMNNIVNDLLTLVRLDKGAGALNLSNFIVNDMVEAIIKRLMPLADERGVSVIMEAREEIEIEADETKVTLAVTNLIQNAIKYNKDNGSVKVSISRDNGRAEIKVSDTGIGIEEEHFDQLFDRFYRVDKARDRETGGSGLGLSIVKGIVSLHGGRVEVESVPGEGSTFTISLPVDQTTEGEDEE